nr:MAG TPA: hypothetical protein [Caudoviricetes sp.]
MLHFQSIRQNVLLDFHDAFYRLFQALNWFSLLPSVSRYLLGE